MSFVTESTRLLYPRVWDLKCLAAAFCFVVSNVLFVVHMVQEMARAPARQPSYASYDPDQAHSAAKPANYGFESLKDLDPVYIEGQWADRLASRHYLMVAAVSRPRRCAARRPSRRSSF